MSARNALLYAASLLFYAWGEPVYVFLMLFSTLLNYALALPIEKLRGRTASKILLSVAVVADFGILFFFKYAVFAAEIVGTVTGLSVAIPALTLPVGISFYTFQTVSYVIDVYRGQAPAQKNPINFGAYIAFFPQLIAGPIVRYKQIAEQLTVRNESLELFGEGAFTFTKGLAKKVLLANNIGLLFSGCSDLSAADVSVLSSWLGALAFSLQLYFDFSGYSDMAVGLGKMFGFTFPENFRYPYISRSATEFWRRWHISLGTWFRDYLYFPLGGSRRSEARTYFNLLIVWLCTGIWHGAGWTFIVWGLYFAVLIIAEKAFLLKLLEKLPKPFGHIYLLLAVIIGWVLFSSESLNAALISLKQMFFIGGVPLYNDSAVYLLYTNAIPLILCIIFSIPLPRPKNGKLISIMRLTTGTAIWILATAFLVSDSYNPFLYFRF